MTAEDLIRTMNDEYGLCGWPLTRKVDPHTYAFVCQFIFERKEPFVITHEFDVIQLSIGKHNGIMFKNVELVLEK